MIPVEKISMGFRDIGLNYGFPMTFVKLGMGDELTVDQAIREVIKFPGCNWVCILGKETTRTGMGAFIKSLSKMGMYVEVENDGRDKEPGWVHQVDRWLVKYTHRGAFNFFSLRKEDMILFDMKDIGTEELGVCLDLLRPFAGTKCIRASKLDIINPDFLELVRKQDRCRVYQVGK